MDQTNKCRFFHNLTSEQARDLLLRWDFWARPEQLAPSGRWRTWLFLGGRGAGKTRAGAEWIVAGLATGAMRRVGLVGATFRDARAVMIEGESGLLAQVEGASFEPSNARVLLPNGAVATVLSAEEPDAIRGHQFDAAWGDEFCKWQDPQHALDMLRMALRLGKKPQLMLTTTPRNIAALKDLMAERATATTRSATKDNEKNLAPDFVGDLEARYGGTRLGRQELDAEIVEDAENAPFKREWIERARVGAAPPDLARVVIAVDPPASARGAECGIVAAGIAADGQGYLLGDYSAHGLSPAEWAARVVDAYERHEADSIVAEVNQGGDMVGNVLNQEMHRLPVKQVRASRGKRARAEPAAMLYEQGRIHHVGAFAELEDQMCTYDGTGASPDRMDALVWAVTELFPKQRRGEPKVRSF